jgi:hypothetical protein
MFARTLDRDLVLHMQKTALLELHKGYYRQEKLSNRGHSQVTLYMVHFFNMKYSALRCIAIATSIMGSMIPITTFAATSQQILNASLASLHAAPGISYSGNIVLNMSQRSLRKDYVPEGGTITVSYTNRTVRTSTTTQDSEGYVSIDKIQSTGTSKSADAAMIIALSALEQPAIRIHWKKAGTMLYIYIDPLPQPLLEILSAAGIDTTSITDRWINFDIGSLADMMSAQTKIDETILMDPQALSAFVQPLRVRWTDKRFIDSSGDHIVRMRVGLNPLLITQAQNAELKKVDRSMPGWRKRITEIYARYAKLRRDLSRVAILVQINQDKGTLDRVEIGASFTESKKTCSMNYTTYKNLCVTSHMETSRVSIGINVKRNDGVPVIAPTTWITIQDLMQEIEAKMNATATTTPAVMTP